MQAGLVAVEELPGKARWRLKVDSESLRAEGLRERLATVLSQHLETPVELELLHGSPDDSPARRQARERVRGRPGTRVRQGAPEPTQGSDPPRDWGG